MSQLLGFYVDRILKINRVPPTAWVELPLSWIQAAVNNMDPLYIEWFEVFFVPGPGLLWRALWSWALGTSNGSSPPSPLKVPPGARTSPLLHPRAPKICAPPMGNKW